MHLVLGAVFGVMYCWLFERALHWADAGAIIAIPHAIPAGTSSALVPTIHDTAGSLSAGV